MSGARGVAEVYRAQWAAHLNSAVANALRQTLAEKPSDPIARIGRLLTAAVDEPAPQFVPVSASPLDPLSQAQSDDAYSSRWNVHISATVTQALEQTLFARPADPVVHLGRLLLAASTAGTVTALEAENASLRAQLERERAMRAIDPSLASSASSEKMAGDINEDPKDAMLREFQEEIARLRAKLDGKPMASGGGGAAPPGGPPAERRLVERMVDVEVEKIVEVGKIVEVEKEVEAEKEVEMEKEVKVEKKMEVEKEVEVEREVEVENAGLTVASEYQQLLSVSGSPQITPVLLLIL
jgi:hypothetical protein